MRRKILQCSLIAFSLISSEQILAAEYADRVFIGDNIITMDPSNADAEAVAIQGDKIIYVGDDEGLKPLIGDQTEVVELGDKTLIPGMIDSHGHITMTARLIDWVNASSPPVGPAEKIDDILKLLKERLASNPPAEGEWLLAYGYDDSLLVENRHPNRDDLDKVSKEVPIYLMHVSGHLGAANSAALAAAGIDENTENPEGGVFRRFPDSKVPNGVVEETATRILLMPQFIASSKNPALFREQLKKTVDYYASFGITTIQDGGAQLPDVNTMRAMADNGEIVADIVAFPVDKGAPFSTEEIEGLTQEGYHKGVRVGGVKFVLDGSPQGRTAWTTEPYVELPHGAEDPYTAYPTVDPEKFKAEAKVYLDNGIPIYMHGNGDAAIDLAMDAVEEAFEGQEIPDHRSVIIHAQLMRPDQILRAKKLKMVPSFYAAHAFFWGDWHRKSFGDKRAFGISPSQSALKNGVHFTLHNDTPVVPPHMMRLMWAAVNRETRDGVILGEEERLSSYDALYALTQGGAYQYFEEDTKGSISQGKQADLVILGENPLEVDPGTIKDVPILETIAHGKTIFVADSE